MNDHAGVSPTLPGTYMVNTGVGHFEYMYYTVYRGLDVNTARIQCFWNTVGQVRALTLLSPCSRVTPRFIQSVAIRVLAQPVVIAGFEPCTEDGAARTDLGSNLPC